MSNAVVEDRVVSMQFDNKNFEKNVQITLDTLEELKQKLNLTGASKGLENVSAASKKVDMSGLSTAVETVSAKFSALQVMGITALANLTNSAVNAGKQIVSALTIDPVKTGLSEYETQINAVQTILANTESKGSTLKDVNAALDELNTYADKTIYNFTEMTRNIGTFTAAGVDLDKSVSAIQGIANLAAVSGSTSQQASTAMYQLSQALSSGSVKLQDWNSVVNAGMGGQVFQDALKRTAQNMGTDVDKLIKKYGSFRESLSKGEWLTADVLTKTLEQFTLAAEEGSKQWKKYKKSLMKEGYSEKDAEAILKMANTATNAATKVKTASQLWDTLKETAQSGWTQTWEIIMGDFEEAKDLFSDIYNTLSPLIEASSKTRNDLLEGWSDLGGRKALIEAFFNVIKGGISIVKPIKEAFHEIFPPATAEQLYKITDGLRNLTSKLIMSDEQSASLKTTFKGLFSIIDVVVTVIKEVTAGVIKLIRNFSELDNKLFGVAKSFGEWGINLRKSVKETDIIGTAVDKVVGFLQKAIDKIKEFTGAIKKKISAPGFDGFYGLMRGIWDIVSKMGRAIGKVAAEIGKALYKVFKNGDIKELMELFNAGMIGAILGNVKKWSNGLKEFGGGLKDILDSIVGILDQVKDSLKAWQENLKAGALLKIAGAVAILAASIVLIAAVDPAKLASSLTAIGVLFGELLGSMALFNKMGGDYQKTLKASTMMIGISVAVLILANALRKIATLKTGELAKGLVGIAVLSAVVVASARSVSKDSKRVMKGATSIVIFAAAIKVLTSACIDLSTLSWQELAKGLVGVGVLIASVSLFLNNTKFSRKAISNATGVVLIAASIKILASACSDFAGMSWKDIGKGLASVGGLLTAIAIFTRITGKAKHVQSTGIALVLIGAAMKIFASAIQDFASMSWQEIGKGLTVMAGALAAITIAVNLMPKNMFGISVAMVVMASALLILTNVLEKMGFMSWEEIGKGLATLGGSIVILSLGLNAMKKSIGGSAALLIAVGALAILTPILKVLGDMSWQQIGKGLGTIAGALAIIGIAGLVLKPVIPAIIKLATAMALIGAAFMAAGVGITLFAAGFNALAVSLATGATAIVAALAVVVEGILNLFPTIASKIGEFIVAIGRIFSEGAPALGEAIKAIILTILDVLISCVPPIVATVLKLLVGVISALAEYAPQLVDSIFKFIVAVLEGVAKNLPSLIQSVVNVIMSFFQGVIDALNNIDPNLLKDGILAVGFMSALMLALSVMGALAPAAMLGVLGVGAVIAELALVLAAIGAMEHIPGLTWLVESSGPLLGAIGKAIGAFVGGFAGSALQGMTSAFPQIGNDLSNFMKNMTPFIEGAKTINPSVMDGVKSLTGVILALTAANILDGIGSWLTGKSSVSSFASELPVLGKGLLAFSDSVTGLNPENVTVAANAAKAIAELTKAIPNEGGVASWFAGENSISKFAGELPTLGEGILGFSNAVVGTNAENVVAAANAAKAIAEMTEIIPNSGGVASWFAGENSISKFASELPALGQGILGFSNSVTGLNPENITAAATAAKSIAEMTDTIPNSGGVASWFAGNNSISKFAEEIEKLGEGLFGFSRTVIGMNPDNVTSAANAAKSLAEMTKTIPNSGGVVAWFTGDNSITKFAKELPTLGSGLLGFSNSVSGINPENVTAAANAGKTLAEMTKTAPKKTDKVISFGNSLATFGDKLKTYFDKTSAISADMLKTNETIINSVKTITTGFKTTAIKKAGDAIDALVNALQKMDRIDSGTASKFEEALTTIGDSNILSIVKAFTDAAPKLMKAGEDAVLNIKKGAENIKESVKTAFYDIGAYLVTGFANGISDNTFKAKAKAKEMAKAASDAAKEELDEHSPSKVGYEIGDFFGMAFVNAIGDYVSKAYNAGSEIAGSAKNGLGEAIAKINDFVSNGMDSQPTIRPVLDLSEVTAGAGSISSLFNMRPSVGVMSNVGAINSMMNGRIQNGTTDDVVRALKDLKGSIETSTGDTISINGITYDDGSNISSAVKSLIRAARVERRV